MGKLDPAKIKNPIWLTVLIMSGGALLGTVIGSFIILTFGMAALLPLGPLGFFLFGPMLIAQTAASSSITMYVIPLWSWAGGWLFAVLASGTGGVAGKMGVTLFSEGHPIHRFINEKAAELALPPIKWVGWFNDEAINAFAFGVKPENALVAFSKGAIEKLAPKQFEAVMAHELAHIASNDMARMAYARGVQDALTWFLVFRGLRKLARWVFTPTSELALMHLSRQREYWADAIAAVLTSPEAMIGALQAIEADTSEPPRKQRRYANFMFRANAHSWFATHPPLADRVEAVRSGRFTERLVSASASAR